MFRVANIGLFTAAMVFAAGMLAAQDAPAPAATPAAPALSVLEQTAQQKTAAWNKLSQNLESSILRLLPCDPKATAAITDVSKASEARLAAIAAYLEAAGGQALAQTESARRILASAKAVGTEISTEQSDLAPERAGVDGQLANLAQSAQGRPSFVGAQDALKQVSSLELQRFEALDSVRSHADSAASATRDWVAQLEARQAAWKDVQTAFEAERSRWSLYYAARLARAQTECAITQGAGTGAATKGTSTRGSGTKGTSTGGTAATPGTPRSPGKQK